MKQRIEDLILLLKSERKYQVMSLLAVVAVIFLLTSEPKRKSARPKLVSENTPAAYSAPSASEAYPDIVQRFSTDVEEIKTATRQNASDIRDIRQNQTDNEQRTAEIFKKILERIAETQPGSTGAKAPSIEPELATEDATGGVDTGSEAPPSDEMVQFGDNTDTVAAPPPPPGPQKVAFVGAGDSVRVKLLAGVNAPTDGTPYPVVFKLISDIYGPDGSALPIGEARLIAAAQGSLADQRTLFRITTLNIRLPDGRRKVYPVDGWIVGEDGLRGMSGQLIDPIGKAIGAAGMAGGLQALGEGFAQTQVSTTQGFYGQETSKVTGDPLIYAAGRGLGGASSEWSQIVRDRVNQLVPHVQVLSGREGTAVFAKSLAIYELYNSLDSEETGMANVD